MLKKIRFVLFIMIVFLSLAFPSLCFASASRSFDDANDEITFGDNINVTTGDYSWGIWSKTTDDNEIDWFHGKDTDSSSAASAGYSLRQRQTGDTLNCTTQDGTNEVTVNGTTDIDTVWSFNVCVWDGTNDDLFVYRNSALEASTTTGTIGSLTTTAALKMGEDASDNNDLDGSLAYGFGWRKILTVAEIAQEMWLPGTFSGDYTGFWPLWGDSPELDLSGNGITGTVTGATASNDGPPVMFGSGLPI